jgi:hypothetical protein
MDGKDDRLRGFSLCLHSSAVRPKRFSLAKFITLLSLPRFVSTARLEGNIWKCAGGGSLTAGSKCEGSLRDFFLWPQYSGTIRWIE